MHRKQAAKIAKKLNGIKWPKELMLFSHSGTLLIVDAETLEVYEKIDGIINDGGDPGTTEIDDREYLNS